MVDSKGDILMGVLLSSWEINNYVREFRMTENNYAFIDSQNLNLGIISIGWKLDFKKFRLYLRNKYSVSKAYIFIGYVSKYKELYSTLRSYGYILIFKPTLEFQKGDRKSRKGNVDAELVLHTMIEKEHYDKAIIISGDGDFCCLAEYLKQCDKLKKIIVPNSKYSGLLRSFNPYIVNLEYLRNSLETKETKISGRSKS